MSSLLISNLFLAAFFSLSEKINSSQSIPRGITGSLGRILLVEIPLEIRFSLFDLITLFTVSKTESEVQIIASHGIKFEVSICLKLLITLYEAVVCVMPTRL